MFNIQLAKIPIEVTISPWEPVWDNSTTPLIPIHPRGHWQDAPYIPVALWWEWASCKEAWMAPIRDTPKSQKVDAPKRYPSDPGEVVSEYAPQPQTHTPINTHNGPILICVPKLSEAHVH
jgi:hypothetical protein